MSSCTQLLWIALSDWTSSRASLWFLCLSPFAFILHVRWYKWNVRRAYFTNRCKSEVATEATITLKQSVLSEWGYTSLLHSSAQCHCVRNTIEKEVSRVDVGQKSGSWGKKTKTKQTQQLQWWWSSCYKASCIRLSLTKFCVYRGSLLCVRLYFSHKYLQQKSLS